MATVMDFATTAAAPSVSLQRVVSTPLTAALRAQAPELYAQWQELFANDPAAYTLQHPDWVLAEPAAATGGVLLQALQGDTLCALGVLVPKQIATRKLSGPGLSWMLKGLRLAGNRFLQRGDSPDRMAELLPLALEHVRQSQAAFLMIEDLDRQTSLAAHCQAATQQGWKLFAPKGWQPRLRIDLPTTADEYWKKFSSKTRSTFRRKLKKFGTTRLEKITADEQVANFLAQAEEISKQTWQTRQLGLRVRNDSAARATFAAAAQAGLLRSYLWFVNDQPAAFLIGNQAHGVFNYEEVGYATAFAKNSPGQMLLLQVLDELFTTNTPRVFDFGGGDADYKRMFSNSASESGTVWLVPPGYKMHAVLAYLQSYAWVKQQARHWVNQTQWITTLRQRVRYGGAKPTAAKAPPTENEQDC